MKDYQSAADCAFTHLVYNAEDEVMADNLKYYLASGVKKDSLVNREAHVSLVHLSPLFP